MPDKVDVEAMFRNISDRYKLVSAAAQRARALNLGEKPMTDTKFRNNALIALDEIAQGKIKMLPHKSSKADQKESKK